MASSRLSTATPSSVATTVAPALMPNPRSTSCCRPTVRPRSQSCTFQPQNARPDAWTGAGCGRTRMCAGVRAQAPPVLLQCAHGLGAFAPPGRQFPCASQSSLGLPQTVIDYMFFCWRMPSIHHPQRTHVHCSPRALSLFGRAAARRRCAARPARAPLWRHMRPYLFGPLRRRFASAAPPPPALCSQARPPSPGRSPR